MKPLPVIDPANDNGKPEDHLAVATVALHTAVKGLEAPVELLASKIKAPAEGASQRWPAR
jgi:hypothetical protein